MTSNLNPLPGPNQFISVLQVRPSPKPGAATKAYADILYHNALIKGWSVVEKKVGGHFVSPPANNTGKRFFPIVELSDPDRTYVENLILAAAREAGLI
jgi:hypothetical protein